MRGKVEGKKVRGGKARRVRWGTVREERMKIMRKILVRGKNSDFKGKTKGKYL